MLSDISITQNDFTMAVTPVLVQAAVVEETSKTEAGSYSFLFRPTWGVIEGLGICKNAE